MKYPNNWQLQVLMRYLLKPDTSTGVEIKPGETVWFPSRPEGFPSLKTRIKLAWLVFTGKADALTWPHQ